jgi:hypothetical protein
MTHLSDKNVEAPAPEPESDQEWNEEALAQLVGLEHEARVENHTVPLLASGEEVVSQADLFDVPIESDPHKNKTERNLAKKPLPKLALVAAALLVVFGIGGFVLSTMMSSKKNGAPNSPKVAASPKTSIVEKKALEKNQEGELKTQLALSKQADDLKEIDERSKGKKSENKVKPGDKKNEGNANASTPAPTPSPTPAPSTYRSPPPPPPPPPARSSYTSVPIRSATVPTSVPVREAPVSAPVPSPLPPPPPPSALAPHPLNREPIKLVDPATQWNTLAMLGSFGRTGMSNDDKLSSSAPTAKELEPGTANRTNPGKEHQFYPQPSQRQSPKQQTLGDTNDAELRVIEGVPIRRLVPGASAAASLSTSLLWSQEFKEEQRFVVALAEPLMGVNGTQVIPAGQQIVFVVKGIDSNGLVQTFATSIIDQEGNEEPLPPSAITVQADQERPLQATGLFDPGGKIASMDFGIAALGATAAVGEILNRPLQQQSTSSTGAETTTSTSSVSGDPNILGAIMDGATSPLLDTIQKRNEDAIKRLSNQKNAWFLPVGESVRIVVTQPVELGSRE